MIPHNNSVREYDKFLMKEDEDCHVLVCFFIGYSVFYQPADSPDGKFRLTVAYGLKKWEYLHLHGVVAQDRADQIKAH